MFKKILRKIAFAIVIFLLFGTSIFIAKADDSSYNTLSELRIELSALKQKKASQDKEKSKTETELNIQKENVYEASLTLEEIENKKLELELEIVSSKSAIEKLEEQTNNILAFIEISKSDNLYYEYILRSENVTDLVMRQNAIEQIVEYNDMKLNELRYLIKYDEELKEELSNMQVEYTNSVKRYEQRIDELGEDISSLVEVTESIDSQIAMLEKLINTYIDKGCHEDEDLATCVGLVNTPDWLKPFEKGIITSAFGWRVHPTQNIKSFHNGIDIGGVVEGTPIYSTTNGEVIAITTSDCGGNKIYIKSLVKSSKYIVYYFHVLDVFVSVGDIVTTDDIIATVGGGSQSQAKLLSLYGYTDSCTTGAHLHYGVAATWDIENIGISNCINPPGYPALGEYFYSRYQTL